MRYFKQYGARRTGTNYLRALLELNFQEVVVLMHTLGGKHGVPVDLRKLLSASAGALAFTEAATVAAPAENSLPLSAAQREFMATHADGIAAACAEQTLHYLVSVKNPYAWINSMLGHSVYRRNADDENMLRTLCELTREKCAEYNLLCRAYRDLALRCPAQTSVIRYDDLLAAPGQVLDGLREKLSLRPVALPYVPVTAVVRPTGWDQQESRRQQAEEAFDRDYYLGQLYLNDLHPGMIAVLEKEMDWELMAYFGYSRMQMCR